MRICTVTVLLTLLLSTCAFAQDASSARQMARNAAMQSNSVPRVRLRQTLILRDRKEEQREWRMIGDEHYYRKDGEFWRRQARRSDWMEAAQGQISDCKRVGLNTIDGVNAMLWTYRGNRKGVQRTVKMWTDERATRVVRTEIEFAKGQGKYQRSISRFDYGNRIQPPPL